MSWAFTVDNGLPFTSIVTVSSFSVAIKLPNQDFLVSSGVESGVIWRTSSFVTVECKRERHERMQRDIECSEYSLCIFLLWKRGLPRKLFLIFVNLVFHNWLPLVPDPFGSFELFICEPVGGGSIADFTIGSLSQKLLGIIIGPELARWWTGEVVHDDVVRRLLLLLLTCVGVPKLSMWFFIRPDGCRIGVFVEAGDDGRKTPTQQDTWREREHALREWSKHKLRESTW